MMMKKFLLVVCGSFVGSFLALAMVCVCAIAMSFSIVFAMATGTAPASSIKDKSVLLIKLEGPISERNAFEQPGLIEMLQGKDLPLSLEAIVKAIHVAKSESKVKGIVISCAGASAAPATLHAIRMALQDFKAGSKKFVYAWANEGYAQGDYYVASVADSVLMNPLGVVDLHGMVSMTPYFKKLLDKAGVEMQVLRVGTFKSAVEPFMLDSISPANRLQQTVFMGNIWKSMEAEMAKDRKIDNTVFDAMVDSMMLTKPAQELKARKIIDGTCYKHEFEAKLKSLIHVGEKDDLRFVYPDVLASHYDNGKNKDGIIAVVYAVGEIDGAMDNGINSEELVKTILDLKDKDDVKGMVLRVNSPGGSAFGSEQIWEAVDQFKKAKKTVAVSMGDYAASGGYYISCGAHRIFADSTTITGSIGIFGLVPCVQKLMEDKLGVTTSIVKTNANSEFSSGGFFYKKMTPVQQQAMQNMINRGYEIFTKRCAEGRKIPQDSIKKIAEGRVWDGMSAKRIGLVDEFGGLSNAIDWVARAVKLNDGYYEVKAYPETQVSFVKLFQQYAQYRNQEQLKRQMGIFYTYYEELQAILNRQHVLCLMPPIEIR